MKPMANSPKPVILEPNLEARASDYDPLQCRALAALYRRWAHQLSIKARILEIRRHRATPPPAIKKLSQGRLRRN